jgi:hypothetical protein
MSHVFKFSENDLLIGQKKIQSRKPPAREEYWRSEALSLTWMARAREALYIHPLRLSKKWPNLLPQQPPVLSVFLPLICKARHYQDMDSAHKSNDVKAWAEKNVFSLLTAP